MKIKVWCNNGANIHSKRQETIDLEDNWNISGEEWNEMSDDEKDELVQEWAMERFEYGWDEA